MKNKVKCPDGHFYNADIFDECPLCGQVGSIEIESDEDVYGDNKSVSKIGRIFGTSKSRAEVVAASPPIATTVDFEHAKTEAIFEDEIEDFSAQEVEVEDVKVESVKVEDIAGDIENVAVDFESTAVDIESTAVDFENVETVVIDEDEYYEEPIVDSQDDVTYAVWEDEEGITPVCGWIVCTKGVYKGKSFEVKSGNNYIGRDSDMDISLSSDQTVSRKRHSAITYDRLGHTFYLQQGESSGTTYLNKKIVFAPTEVKSEDRIIIGNAEFIFISLCSERFDWEEKI
jgi:hypothetical protein